MKSSLIRYLSRFDKFTQQEINAVAENTQLESFKKGAVILEQGQVSTKCIFVLEGCLRQYKIVDGGEKTTAFFFEEEAAVLYSSYLKKEPSNYYLSTIENSVLATGTKIAETKLHDKHPKLESLISTLMSVDFNKSTDHIELLTNYPPEKRYQIILRTNPKIIKRVPLHYIASYIGVTPESLSRIRKRIVTNEKP